MTRNGLTLGPASLIVNGQGGLYHVEAAPDRLANGMILVGDPERAKWFAHEFLSRGLDEWSHRGHYFATGDTQHGCKMSVITTAMGVGSTDIIVTEVIAAKSLDLEHRRNRRAPPRLGLLRLGTCGALQADLKLGVPIVSTGAIDLSGNSAFNQRRPNKFDDLAEQMEEALFRHHDANRPDGTKRHHFYASGVPASPFMLRAIHDCASRMGLEFDSGVTVTAPGFYHSQGRSVLPGMKPAIPNLDEVIAGVDPTVKNFEMEAAVILGHAFNSMPRHHAGCICIPVAHRPSNTFMQNLGIELPRQMKEVAELGIATIEAMYQSGAITPN